MAETVLLVDDDPVCLKAVAAMLRREGYKVHLSSSAEQALTALNTIRPDLMLVDLQLPGINGLELTRRVRAKQGVNSVIIVALTASDSSATEARAFEAGCNGFIAKSMDERSLVRRVRALIDRETQGSMPAEQPAILQARPAAQSAGVEDARGAFLAEGARQLRRLLEFAGTRQETEAMAPVFQQWAETAGELGYTEIAGKARAAETLLGRMTWTHAELGEALTELMQAFATPKEVSEAAIPDSVVQVLSGKRVALLGFADEEANKLCAAFEKALARPHLFSASEHSDSDAVRNCGIVIVHVRPQTLHSEWLMPGNVLPPELALVLVGTREHLEMLGGLVSSQACECLNDGWQPEELVTRLSAVISGAAETRQPETAEAASKSAEVAPAPGTRPDDSRAWASLTDEQLEICLEDFGYLSLFGEAQFRPLNALTRDQMAAECDHRGRLDIADRFRLRYRA
jgi:two-component system cell cycle response regulator DivK